MEVIKLYFAISNNMVITFLFVMFTTFIVMILFRNKKNHHINLPPGTFGWPVIGETINFISLHKEFIHERMNRYSPKLFKTSIMGEKMAVFCDAPGNKFIFSNEKFLKTWIPDAIKKIAAPTLKTEAEIEDDLSTMRRLQFEFLRPQAIQRYVQQMDVTVKNHMDSEWAPNSTITVEHVAKKLTVSVACALFMGLDYKSARIDKLEHHFKILTDGLFSLPIDLPGTRCRRAIKAAETIRNQIENIVRTMKQETNAIPLANNYLSFLLTAKDNQGKLLSDSNIASKVLAILIASYETTSSLITNMVYYLSDHPHVYTLALKEQMEIKSSKGEEQLLTWDDTKKMKYGRNVINEVLRMASILGHFRDVVHDISYEGVTIPKGWKIFGSTTAVHNNPKYFPEPEKFDPTRFDGNGPAPYTFVPFGGGPWMCPGNEFARQTALVFLHNLLVSFKWQKLLVNEKIVQTVSPFPEKGLPIKLQRRVDEYP